ncbi:MAG: GNAT family N-acetyltransferase [SAR324 cluster bacterium]|nr:GNAT family N-acetyltransferase [SAR324 cluster bacterium]
MTIAKINKTIDELKRHPQKGSIIVFEVEKVIVGYAIIIYFWSNEYGGSFANIDELYVKPDYRDKGIGSHFLNSIGDSKKRGIVALQLETTPTNKRALEYYIRLGFQFSANKQLLKKL